MDLESAVSVSRDIYEKILFPAAVPAIPGLLGTFLPSVDKIGFLFPGLCLCIILKILVSKSVWDRLQLKVLCNDRIKISKSVLVSQIFMVLISTKSI